MLNRFSEGKDEARERKHKSMCSLRTQLHAVADEREGLDRERALLETEKLAVSRASTQMELSKKDQTSAIKKGTKKAQSCSAGAAQLAVWQRRRLGKVEYVAVKEWRQNVLRMLVRLSRVETAKLQQLLQKSVSQQQQSAFTAYEQQAVADTVAKTRADIHSDAEAEARRRQQYEQQAMVEAVAKTRADIKRDAEADARRRQQADADGEAAIVEAWGKVRQARQAISEEKELLESSWAQVNEMLEQKKQVEMDRTALIAAWEEVQHVKRAAGLCVAELQSRSRS